MNVKSLPEKITRFGLFLFALGLPISHVPAQFGIGFAFIGWLLEGLLNKRWQLRWHVFLAPLIFYFMWNILAAALSPRPVHSLGAVLDNEWPSIMMLMMFWTIEDRDTLSNLVYAYLMAGSIAMAYAIWQAQAGIELYRGMPLDSMGFGYFRAVGFYGFYLTFAAFAMSVFFLSTSFAVEVKEGRRWLFGSSSVLSFLAVLVTFARSIWLSFAAAIPLLAFSKSRKAGIIVTVSLLLLATVGVLALPALRYRVESIADVSQNETRLNLWKTAIRISDDFPILGIGEDNWDFYFERYHVEGFYDTIVHAHNDYLTVLVSSGYPGLLAFIAMWGIAISTGYRASQRAQDNRIKAIALGAKFSILGFLVGSLFQNYYGTFVNCLGWWFLAGLIMSADRFTFNKLQA